MATRSTPTKRTTKTAGRRRGGAAQVAPRLDVEAITDRSVPGLFLRQVARYSGRTVFHYFDGSEWKPITWKGLGELVLRVAAGLVAAGVQRGDRVILMSENRPEWIYTDLAIQAAGAVTVPVYPSSTPDMVAKIAANSEAVLAVASTDKVAAKMETGERLRRVVRIDGELKDWTDAEPRAGILAEVFARLQSIQPEDVATIIYTSGTTGDPKGRRAGAARVRRHG